MGIKIAIGHVLPREHLMNKIFHVDVSRMLFQVASPLSLNR